MNRLEYKNFLREKCKISLTKEQEEVVFAVDGAVAVIAVPGSGKTTALICRTANLILHHKVRPSRILAISYSRASANDMGNRFSQMFGGIINEKMRFATIHSFSYGVIRTYAASRNIEYTIIEDKLAEVSKKDILRNLYKKYNYGDWVTDDKLEEISNFIGYSKNMMMPEGSIEKLHASRFPCANFMQLYKEYERIKKEKLYIDYDDMLQLCYSILSSTPTMLNAYIERYDYIEIDESQDVSKIQHEIAKLIMGTKHNICLVGDADQAIYSWRGAHPEILLRFRENYDKNAKVLFMSQNFRSTKNIVEVANQFIKNNKDRYAVNIFTNNKGEGQIRLLEVDNNHKQVKFVIEDLKKEVSNGMDCAVLYRNNITSIPLILELISEEIPYYIKDVPAVFFNHWVLKDILNIIGFSYNLSDVETFEKIYYKIKTYIKKAEISELYSNLSREENVFEYLSRNAEDAKNKVRYNEFSHKFKELREIRPSNCIRFIKYELNYEDYIQDFASKFNYNMNSINAILDMLEVICSKIRSVYELETIINSLRSKIESSRKLKGGNAITLTTMHSAKGLEFDKVYIMDFMDEVIPSSIDSVNKAEISAHTEEERRLAYVAITRAKRDAYILYPKTLNGRKNDPSIFYKELSSIINEDKIKKQNAIEIQKSADMQKMLREGVHVKHKTFGKGSIIKKDPDRISVMFDKTSKVHCLSIETLLKNNIIEILDY